MIQSIEKISKRDDQTHLICKTALSLLNNLLDYEFHRDAENFIKIFSSLSPKIIALLNLGIFIQNIKRQTYIRT